MQKYVIDSSVFNKLYLDEIDRDKAKQLFIQAAAGKVILIAPDLLYLEVVNTAQRCGVPIDSVVELMAFCIAWLIKAALSPLAAILSNSAFKSSSIV
jgi:predicted nucleic acid-binding protein